jgi:CTP:molybdopterin cytidylyltransferase MocA
MSKTKDQRSKTLQVAAILLAAGRSSRMGAFKPLLSFGKTTVIRSCIDNLKRGGIGDIVVVLGHRAAEIKEHLADLHLTFALNRNPDSEMSASIVSGVEKLPPETKATLIALTDHPAVPAEVIATLLATWEAGAKLIIPEYDGRGGHPVLIDLEFRKELQTIDPSRGLKSLFDGHRNEVHRLPVNSPYIARDMDTWDDYRRLHLELFSSLPPEQPAKLTL